MICYFVIDLTVVLTKLKPLFNNEYDIILFGLVSHINPLIFVRYTVILCWHQALDS